MGFGTIATHIVFVFLFIAIFTSYLLITNGEHVNLADASKVRSGIDDGKIHQKVTIIEATYDEPSEELAIVWRNDGNNILRDNATDIYIEDLRIPRNNVTRDMLIDTANPRLMDPGDVQNTTYTIDLNTGSYLVTISTPYGTRSSAVITV